MPYQSQPYYYPQAANTMTKQVLGLKGRPVSSLEEVRAAAVDFDGSVSFFPDLANGKIYTKQCNIDGTASLNMYEIKEIPVTPDPTNLSAQYVTRDEFNNAMAALNQALTKTNIVEKSPDQTQSQTSNKEFKF